ncbi:hypothetical protein SAMN04488104_100953 [Algoriphagus faecimaris]|uniref:Uncharacterized protein n=1 Tax=Algoriphagus faecimaris TaxID=686796 RepID=A0A1G6QH76_9BACT|nr:hypothetical protein [Algoriphagus faecimaris]SDC91501.1 hypothetical protein SAMN04488104_100953 [Algoriphagus faecimaris]
MPNSTLASYSFLPWVRQGLGNEILETDFLGNSLPSNATLERPEINVSAKLKATRDQTTQNHTVSKTVKVQGPGDVLGINSKSIIRVHPKNGVKNFETNNLCYVEFYEEDLPWRFTPAKPVGNKLRPWLALIVLRENEFEKSTGGTPTPFISITNEALPLVFCNEKDTYALAHVHVLEDLGDNSSPTAPQLSQKLAQNPDLALSRVLCPRKLAYTQPNPSQDYDPNTYHAFLIPAFETGRLAGLGLDTADVPAQKSSWSRSAITQGTNPSSYPYYHTWSFKVDQGGDFESLAQLLEARELPETIGKREMDMKEMGFGIQPMGSDALGFVEGAMRHPDYKTAPWPISAQQLKADLLAILNLSFNLQDTAVSSTHSFFYSPNVEDDPIITPPVYGKWHKGIEKLSNNGKDWVHQLNLHPSHRAAAGLGVQVVQKHQEKFMEMAWEQIGDINEANQKIRESELMKRTTRSLAVKKVFKLDEFDFINATGKAFDVMKLDLSKTLKKALNSSTVPTAIRSGSFLKVANNFTPTALMNGGVDGAKAVLNSQLYKNLNKSEGTLGKISAAPSKREPVMVLPAVQAFTAIRSVVDNPPVSFMESLSNAILKINNVGFDTADVMAKMPVEFTSDQRKRAEDILNGIKERTENDKKTLRTFIVDKKVFEDRISENFDEGLYGSSKQVLFKKAQASSSEIVQFDQSVIIQNRANYLSSFSKKFIANPEINPKVKLFKRPGRSTLPLDFQQTIRVKLDPRINFNRKLAALFVGEIANKHKPIMAYPRFPFPVYKYLKEISPDYVIPNISEIEPNTITLMETNREFIESFLIGMNHEFSRELLWREFPTDMRGSYFRHFWEYDNDPLAQVEPGEDYEAYVNQVLNNQNARADIREIHKWNKPLGKNEEKPGAGLVLLIKGDLLRKYPNTLVYAQKAVYQNDNSALPRQLSNYKNPQNVKWPVLSGTIEPDVHFFGFELSQEEANGNRSNNPGWFFVLRERPGQVSFGLDDLDGTLDMTPDNWDQVTWEHIEGKSGVQPPYLKIKGVNINLGPGSSGPRAATWGASSSDMAYILYQSPILFARHASTMLND